ncbi:MAG: hypothetical protein JXB62_21645 [Pirellulales bacterium]|nr:hypothetical protein [Pirellulales bacterium]
MVRCGLSVLLAVVLLPGLARAHGMRFFAHAHDDAIHGEASFLDGTPAKHAKVIAYDSAGEKIGEATTDEGGEFTLKTQFCCDHRLVIDAGGGHGTEFTVPASQLSANLPKRGSPLDSVRNEIVELRRQLNQYEQTTRLRDVLGGIGYILGIAGVAFYFLSRRRKQPTPPG